MAEDRGHGEGGPPPERRSFRRRRPPSPQATRLMLVSLAASIGLAVVLGVVFLPILFEFEDRTRNPVYFLQAETQDGTTRLTVFSASAPRPFDAFEVALLVWAPGAEEELKDFHHGPLDPAIPVGPVSFEDANANGILDEGDYFEVSVEDGTTYTLLILMADETFDDPLDARGVGGFRWTVPPPDAAP